jgi:hypothetical protein
MDNTITISSGKPSWRRKNESILVLFALSIIIGSFLRISLLLIYPVIALLIAGFYRFKISSSFIILSGLAMLSFFLSLFGHPLLRYKFLSLFYMLPFLLLLFSQPVTEKEENTNHLSIFFNCLSVLASINNLIGIVQVFLNPGSDDSFLGLYSQYSVSINGLMIINTTLFFYYLMLYIKDRKTSFLLLFIFFGVCANLGFYGAGLIICIAAFIFTFLKFEVKHIIKTFFIGIVALATIYFLMLFLKPVTLEYNIANIKHLITNDVQKGSRKLASFYNYGTSYPKDAKDFIFGSGPGTFNSRSAFMVGSPSYFKTFSFIKDDQTPYYFKNYAYTLWNESNTIQSMYLDGFRNQPFSSLLAFLGEYGLLFTIVFFLFYYSYFMKVTKLYNSISPDGNATIAYRMFKFLSILLPLLLLIDNYLEYPEIILLIVPAIKFAHMELLSIKYKLTVNER